MELEIWKERVEKLFPKNREIVAIYEEFECFNCKFLNENGGGPYLFTAKKD
jgi:hypothetical protein